MLDIFKNIDPVIFIVSFTIGLFMCYITSPKPQIIIKYPNPDNAGKIIYKDNAETCYKYSSEEVKCPSDKNKIIENPIQDFIIN
tara:strand:- start:309 stop:560 length:252 start_codon:yes stop_codon:yes gene_type:complete